MFSIFVALGVAGVGVGLCCSGEIVVVLVILLIGTLGCRMWCVYIYTHMYAYRYSQTEKHACVHIYLYAW